LISVFRLQTVHNFSFFSAEKSFSEITLLLWHQEEHPACKYAILQQSKVVYRRLLRDSANL